MNIKRARRALANYEALPGHAEHNKGALWIWRGSTDRPEWAEFTTNGAPPHLRRFPPGVSGTYATAVVATYAPKDTRLTPVNVQFPDGDKKFYPGYAATLLGLANGDADKLFTEPKDPAGVAAAIEEISQKA